MQDKEKIINGISDRSANDAGRQAGNSISLNSQMKSSSSSNLYLS